MRVGGRSTLFLLLLLPALAIAQAGGVSIRGTVLGPRGNPLVGVVVTLRADPPRQTVVQTITNQTGQYVFRRVEPGAVHLATAPDGFAPQTLALLVGPISAAGPTIRLRLATTHQQVTVQADAARVDTQAADNRNAIDMSQSALQNLPVFDQDYIATLSRFLDSGDLGNGGVSLVVNGVEAKSIPVSASAIQSVKISNDPYSAAFMRPGRGRIDVFLKPGQPHYHGEFNLTYRDSYFNARNAFAPTRAPEQRQILEGSLTGPIAHSRVNTFLISGHYSTRDTEAVIVAQEPSGPVNFSVSTPSTDSRVSVSAEHLANADNDITLRYSYHGSRDSNSGIGGFTLPEAAVLATDREHQLWYTQRTIFSPNWLNLLQIRLGHEIQPTISVNPAAQIVVQGAFTSGGAQVNELETENHITGGDRLTWTHGRHTLLLGIDLGDWSSHGFTNLDNFGGTFFFTNLASYLQGRPYLYTQQAGNGRAIMLYKRLGFYAQDEIQLTPQFTITAGLRHDQQAYFPDRDNLAPRLSFAYAFGKRSRTVVRGGVGVFYDRFSDNQVADLLHYGGSGLQSYLLTNPGYPIPLGPGQSLTAQPSLLETLQPGIKLPYTMQFSAALERQLGRATMTVTYIGSRRVDTFLSRDLNAPPPPGFLARPIPNLAQWRQIESAGRGTANSIQIMLRGRLTHRLAGLAQYSYGRSYNNTDGIGFFPQNQYTFGGEWGRASYDRRQHLDVEETYSAPAGFELGAALALYSGRPYSITLGQDIYNDAMTNARPAGVARNSAQAPGYADLDLDLSRNFAFRAGDGAPTLNLSLSAFNVFNRVNPGTPVGNLSSPFFGRSISADAARQLQLGMRFEF